VFILKGVKVICFDTLLQVLILKGVTLLGFGGMRCFLCGKNRSEVDAPIRGVPGTDAWNRGRTHFYPEVLYHMHYVLVKRKVRRKRCSSGPRLSSPGYFKTR
jgi:hypothetical protein